jgi:hypothetical protein
VPFFAEIKGALKIGGFGLAQITENDAMMGFKLRHFLRGMASTALSLYG